MRVIMLLSNGFAPDPRVAAEAVALTEAGHQVTVFAWDRTGEFPMIEDYCGVRVVRTHIKTTYSRGPLQIFKFFRFWRAAEIFIATESVDIIHCHDLDTLWPGVRLGRKKGIPVVFDAHESYPDMVAHLFPDWIVTWVRRFEASLIRKTEAVITVGELLANHYRSIKANQVIIVGNYKTLNIKQPTTPPPTPPLKIIYVGGLNRDRLLAPLIETIAGEERFQFYIVGNGAELSKLQQLADYRDNIIFTGFLPQNKARDLMEDCHLVYYAIDGKYDNNQYSTPNLLFLAVAAGRPIITTTVGEIAQIVQKQNCGTILANLEPATIRNSLENYFNSEFWRNQSQNSFQAAINHYNWEYAKHNLISLYQKLEPQHES